MKVLHTQGMCPCRVGEGLPSEAQTEADCTLLALTPYPLPCLLRDLHLLCTEEMQGKV